MDKVGSSCPGYGVTGSGRSVASGGQGGPEENPAHTLGVDCPPLAPPLGSGKYRLVRKAGIKSKQIIKFS